MTYFSFRVVECSVSVYGTYFAIAALQATLPPLFFKSIDQCTLHSDRSRAPFLHDE